MCANKSIKIQLKKKMKEVKKKSRELKTGNRNLTAQIFEDKVTLKQIKILKSEALGRARKAEKRSLVFKHLSEQRLDKLKTSEKRSSELLNMIEDLKSNYAQRYIQKYKTSQKGGCHTWPLWMLQLILELLANGTPPSTIPSNIASHVAIMNKGVLIKELPCLSYIRKCRITFRIVGKTLASYRLAKAGN